MSKKRLSVLAWLLCLAMMLGMLSGCGGPSATGTPAPESSAPGGSPEPGASGPAAPVEPEGVTEVTFWVSVGESLQKALSTHIDAFNASQDEYHVTMEFQGAADDLMAKLGATKQSELPAMYTGAVQHTGFFDSSGFTQPLQALVDQYGGWDYSGTYPHLVTAYSNGDGDLIGYPLGNSFAGIFVNMDIFNAAGIDPYEMKSMQDVYETAKRLQEGGYCDYGVAFHNSGYYFDAAMAVEGVDSVDADNGYGGRATQCLYNTGTTREALQALLTAYQDIYRDGVGVAYGTDMNTEVLPLFGEGKCAMFMGVISYYARIISAMGDTPFDVGMVPMVGCSDNSRSTGMPAAGTGIFVCSNGDDASQKGAYEFIKYLSQPEQVAQWSIDTGYLPVTEDGAATEAYQSYLKENFPRAQVCLDAQKNGDSGTRTPYLPIANEVQSANKLAVEQVANDPNYPVDQAIEDATDTINEALELYNLANPE